MALLLTLQRFLLLVGILVLCQASVGAFQAPMRQSSRSGISSISTANPLQAKSFTRNTSGHYVPTTRAPVDGGFATPTQLSMYKLPPSGGGGGGGGNDNAITQLLQGALTIGAIVLFFASPLGSIFFAITNSLFLLALITPAVLTIAFKVWQSLNTIEGTCPNCGAPSQRVFKDPEQPGICFNCGSILQASADRKSIELSAPTQRRGGGFIDMDQPAAPTASIFDIFEGLQQPQQPTSSSSDDVKAKESKFRREQTVIDVDVTKDD